MFKLNLVDLFNGFPFSPFMVSFAEALLLLQMHCCFSVLLTIIFSLSFFMILQVAPGDVVELSGIFLPIPYTGFRAMRAGLIADTYLEAMSVTHFKKKYEE